MINFKTTNVKSQKAQMNIINGGYIVFNGWSKQGRRQEIFSTYIKEQAEQELKNRLS